jgi:hypothetical protein
MSRPKGSKNKIKKTVLFKGLAWRDEDHKALDKLVKENSTVLDEFVKVNGFNLADKAIKNGIVETGNSGTPFGVADTLVTQAKVVILNPDNVESVLAQTKEKVESVFYQATVKIFGREHTAFGVTISEAISKLKPTNCKGKCVLTVYNKGIKIKERILMPMQTFRLFNSHGLMREVALKQASNLFQGI